MSKVNALRTMHRQVIVTVMKEEGQPTYLVEWPKYCRLTYKEIKAGQSYLEEIGDMVSCSHCSHFESDCWPEKPRLYHREVEMDR